MTNHQRPLSLTNITENLGLSPATLATYATIRFPPHSRHVEAFSGADLEEGDGSLRTRNLGLGCTAACVAEADRTNQSVTIGSGRASVLHPSSPQISELPGANFLLFGILD